MLDRDFFMFKINLSAELKANIMVGIRQLCYFAAVMLLVLLINVLTSIYKEQTFEEHGVIENLQLSLLILSSVTFFAQAVIKREYRQLYFLLSSMSILAAIRECDMFFDTNIPVISWKFAWLFPLAAIHYAVKNFNKTKMQIMQFIATPAFNMMVAAVIVVVPIAQCIGHRPLVVNVLGVTDVAQIKEMFEECVETIGYFVLLMAAIETHWSLPIKK